MLSSNNADFRRHWEKSASIKKRIPAFFSLMFPLFFDSDYTVMLGSFTIKAPAPCVLKKWCRAWQVWNKQHLKRRRTEFKWAEPKAVAEILFMQMKTQGWSFIFYSWGFMAFCLSCQGCVCARLRATATWGRHTHIALSWHQIILRSKNRGTACLWGLEVQVCMVAHTHAMKTFMQEEEVKQDWGGVEYATHHLQCMILLFSARGGGRRKTSV